MISANELRIGNETSFGKVYQIEEDCFYSKKNDVSYKNKWAKIDPIPLTPEILYNCGFTYDGTCFIRKGIFIGEFKSGLKYMPTNQLYWGGNIEIKCLHQLQNLYFSLTGEELNYTP